MEFTATRVPGAPVRRLREPPSQLLHKTPKPSVPVSRLLFLCVNVTGFEEENDLADAAHVHADPNIDTPRTHAVNTHSSYKYT